MNNMEGMTRVLTRIEQIKQRFNMRYNTAENFSSYLIKAENNSGSQPPNIQYNNSSNVQRMLYIAAQKHGVDPSLVDAVAKAESNYQQECVSSAGAVGVMQLMPETANMLGVNNIYDVRENINGGVKYLKQMLDMFHGDTALAVAAYNAGPGAVQKYGGIPPFSETKQYVAKVMSFMGK